MNLLREHFAPQQEIYEPDIKIKLQRSLAPIISEVIDNAIAELKSSLTEETSFTDGRTRAQTDFAQDFLDFVPVTDNVRDKRVFGNASFITLTISHLLRNAIETNKTNQVCNSSPTEKVKLVVYYLQNENPPVVRIEVTNSQSLNESEIKACFLAGGGLMAQKQQNEKWRGKMDGFIPEDGRVTFFLQLDAVETRGVN